MIPILQESKYEETKKHPPTQKKFIEVITKKHLKKEKDLNKIIQYLQTKKYPCYVVGGAPRDFLIGEIPKDYDILVKNISLEKLKKELENFGELTFLSQVKNHIGLKINNKKIDFFIPNKLINKEIKYSEKYTVKDHLNSFDFTMNGLGICLETYQLYDVKNALKDLSNKEIRLINFEIKNENKINIEVNRFMRALRFLSKLKDFTIEEKTLSIHKKKFKKIIKKIKKERLRYEFYYVIAEKYAGKTISLLVEENMLDAILKEYLSSKEWLDESNSYSDNLEKPQRFQLTNMEIEYGEFKKKGWFSFKDINNSIVQEIIKKIKELNIKKEYEVYIASSILTNCFTWDLDISISGPYNEEYIQEILHKITKIGFDYHFYVDVSYVPESFKEIEKKPINEQAKKGNILRETYIYSNTFKRDGKIKTELKEEFEKINKNLYYTELIWPYDKHFKKIEEGHQYKEAISIYNL